MKNQILLQAPTTITLLDQTMVVTATVETKEIVNLAATALVPLIQVKTPLRTKIHLIQQVLPVHLANLIFKVQGIFHKRGFLGLFVCLTIVRFELFDTLARNS